MQGIKSPEAGFEPCDRSLGSHAPYHIWVTSYYHDPSTDESAVAIAFEGQIRCRKPVLETLRSPLYLAQTTNNYHLTLTKLQNGSSHYLSLWASTAYQTAEWLTACARAACGFSTSVRLFEGREEPEHQNCDRVVAIVVPG